MNIEKLTIKTQETVRDAINLAQNNGQQAIEPIHLLHALMANGKEVTGFIFQKSGISARQIQLPIDNEISHLPKVQGAGQPYLSQESNQVMQQAERLASEWGDEFVSMELMLLALLKVSSTASRILKDAGMTEQGVVAAIRELRKGQQVTSAGRHRALLTVSSHYRGSTLKGRFHYKLLIAYFEKS